MIDEELDKNQELVEKIDKNLNKMDHKINKINQQMKKNLEKLRAPGKLIMDICLFFILAVLVGILIWVLKFYFSLQ